MKKIVAIMITVTLMIGILAGCSGEEAGETTVITIEDEKVTATEALFYYYSIIMSYEMQYGEGVLETDMGDGTTLGDSVREEALNSAMYVNLCVYEAKKRGITLDEETLAGITEDSKSYFEQFDQESIDKYGFTLEGLQEIITDSKYTELLFEQVVADAPLDQAAIDEQLNVYAMQDPTLAKIVENGVGGGDLRVRVSHILFTTLDDAGAELSEDAKAEVLAEAEEVLGRINDGEDFVSLVSEYSDDPGSVNNGGEYTFGKGEMVPEFEEAAYSMEPGEVSGLVETSYGYHIIKLLEKDIAYTEEEIASEQAYLDDYTNYIVEGQKQAYFEEQYDSWLETYTTEIDNEAWDAVSIEEVVEGDTTTEGTEKEVTPETEVAPAE